MVGRLKILTAKCEKSQELGSDLNIKHKKQWTGKEEALDIRLGALEPENLRNLRMFFNRGLTQMNADLSSRVSIFTFNPLGYNYRRLSASICGF